MEEVICKKGFLSIRQIFFTIVGRKGDNETFTVTKGNGSIRGAVYVDQENLLRISEKDIMTSIYFENNEAPAEDGNIIAAKLVKEGLFGILSGVSLYGGSENNEMHPLNDWIYGRKYKFKDPAWELVIDGAIDTIVWIPEYDLLSEWKFDRVEGILPVLKTDDDKFLDAETVSNSDPMFGQMNNNPIEDAEYSVKDTDTSNAQTDNSEPEHPDETTEEEKPEEDGTGDTSASTSDENPDESGSENPDEKTPETSDQNDDKSNENEGKGNDEGTNPDDGNNPDSNDESVDK